MRRTLAFDKRLTTDFCGIRIRARMATIENRTNRRPDPSFRSFQLQWPRGTAAVKRSILQTILCCFFALSLSVISCSPLRARNTATESVEEFRLAWRRTNYKDIYTRADQAFKERVTEREFVVFGQSTREKLGDLRSSKLVEDHVNFTATGTFVVLVYDTEYANGNASEQFAWRINGNQSLLYNYTLNFQIPHDQGSINSIDPSVR